MLHGSCQPSWLTRGACLQPGSSTTAWPTARQIWQFCWSWSTLGPNVGRNEPMAWKIGKICALQRWWQCQLANHPYRYASGQSFDRCLKIRWWYPAKHFPHFKIKYHFDRQSKTWFTFYHENQYFFLKPSSRIREMNGLDFHGRSMTRPQACALSRPTNRLLGKVHSTGRFQPSPVKSGRLPRARSWAKSSAEAQSVTIISHFSFNAASSSESTFGPGPLNPRGAPECSVQNSLGCFGRIVDINGLLHNAKLFTTKHATENWEVAQSGPEADLQASLPLISDQDQNFGSSQLLAPMLQHAFRETPTHQVDAVWGPMSIPGTFAIPELLKALPPLIFWRAQNFNGRSGESILCCGVRKVLNSKFMQSRLCMSHWRSHSPKQNAQRNLTCAKC